MPSQPLTKSKSAANKRAKPGPSTLSRCIPSEPPRKKRKPITSLTKPPVFDLTGDDSPSERVSPLPRSDHYVSKGKAKDEGVLDGEAYRTWIDRFVPMTESDLAIHKRKIQDVRHWLLEALVGPVDSKLKKYRRILALTGPAGTGKTATLRVLAAELGIEIIEWRNSVGEAASSSGWDNNRWEFDETYEFTGAETESLADKFITFLARASSCKSIFVTPTSDTSSSSSAYKPAQSSSQHVIGGPRQLILLEDLPNLLHQRTQEAVHEALLSYLSLPAEATAPLVVIVSDAGLRGETMDERTASTSAFRGKEAIDIRTAIPPELLNGPFVTQISFNPIAETYLRKALQTILVRANISTPGQHALDIVIATANGDIRSAINALEFACSTGDSSKGKGRKQGSNTRALLESVTRREQSMALFHLIGRILYNKRKGDQPASSLSQKKAVKEREIDSRLPEPPPLPPHLQAHHRRTSRVDVDALYADSPIDSSLLALYIQQNYTQYCEELENCVDVADVLSWVDSSNGEKWYQVNPHQFHLLTLGTLHALPSPVPRKDQKNLKPAFFEILKRERDAADAVHDARQWLQKQDGMPSLTSAWSRDLVALELGIILRAREAIGDGSALPAQHSLFSVLAFDAPDNSINTQIEEHATDLDTVTTTEPEEHILIETNAPASSVTGGWLEDDDIEDD